MGRSRELDATRVKFLVSFVQRETAEAYAKQVCEDTHADVEVDPRRDQLTLVLFWAPGSRREELSELAREHGGRVTLSVC